MATAARYHTLISSLPTLPPTFEVHQAPIGRLLLERRLRMLTPRDAERLAAIEGLTRRSTLETEADDAEIVAHCEQALEVVDSEPLRAMLLWRIDLRTLQAALRRRGRGEALPDPGSMWGYGEMAAHIRRNWNDPLFRLQGRLPWVEELKRLYDAEESEALEHALFQLVWSDLAQRFTGHYFDFEAVVWYCMRWDLVERWSHYAPAPAQQRFAGLLEEGMGDYTQLFAEAR